MKLIGILTFLRRTLTRVALFVLGGASILAPSAALPQVSRQSTESATVAATDEILARWKHLSANEVQHRATAGNAEAQFVYGMRQSARTDLLANEASKWMFAAVSNGKNLTDQEKADSKAKWTGAPDSELRAAAGKGERGAQWFLGWKVQNTAETQAHEVIYWLERAANQSYAPAEYQLGAMLFKGGPAGNDNAKAREWFNRAAAHGCEGAQHRLALMLLVDAENIPRAVDLLRQAADQGCPLAAFHLAQQYACGNGEPRDYEDTPLTWLRKSATNGLPEAKFGIAERYRAGLGIQRDLLRAITWYRNAYTASKDYIRDDKSEHVRILSPMNANNLVQRAVAGLMDVLDADGSLVPGTRVPDPDFVTVLQIDVKANRLREADAQVRLGELFEEGVLTSRDYARAYLYYSLAARQNATGAAARRDTLRSRLSAEDLKSVKIWTEEYDQVSQRKG